MASPSVLVTDPNIWIDLENGGILAEVFGLPYQFLTPDFAIRELVRPKWPMLQALGLQSQELEPATSRSYRICEQQTGHCRRLTWQLCLLPEP